MELLVPHLYIQCGGPTYFESKPVVRAQAEHAFYDNDEKKVLLRMVLGSEYKAMEGFAALTNEEKMVAFES